MSTVDEEGTRRVFWAPYSVQFEAQPVLREKPSKRPLSWGPGHIGRPMLLFGAHDIYRASGEVKLEKNTKNPKHSCY